MMADDDENAAQRSFDIWLFRTAEMRSRAVGRYEQANAWRLMADALELTGQFPKDASCFDRGVFDLNGPKDFDAMPFLVLK